MNSVQKFRYNFNRVTNAKGVARDDGATTFTKEQLDAAVAKAVQEQQQSTAGLVTKNNELLGDIRKLKDTVKSFEGLDVESLKALKVKLDNDEELKLIAEGKHTEVIQRHTERMRAAHTAELEAVNQKVSEANARADKYKAAVLDNHIRAAAQGLHPGAVEDALLYGRTVFTLDDNGNAVKIENGAIAIGKDGKTPFGPGEWFEQMKEAKPHWFPSTTSGSGSGNAREAGNGVKTMKRSDFEALPAMKKAEVAKSGVQLVD